jgi:hypothetical protein
VLRPNFAPLTPRTLGTADNLIESEAEDASRHFKFCNVLTVMIGPCVSRNWLLALISENPIRGNVKNKRRRETLTRRIVRLTFNNDRNDVMGAAQRP